jgi:phosphopantetheine--protein transferase-like protein
MRSIGIDTVDIHRFIHWHLYTIERLRKVYTEREIMYCAAPINNNIKAQRFAVRYAAKEACYKALCAANLLSCSFISFARTCELTHTPYRVPRIILHQDIPNTQTIQILCSLTHTNISATALVLLI